MNGARKNRKHLKLGLGLRAKWTAFSERYGYALMSPMMTTRREIFLRMQQALVDGRGFGFAKVGGTEIKALFNATFLADRDSMTDLLFHWCGVFPADAGEVRHWLERYRAASQELEVLSLTDTALQSYVLARSIWSKQAVTWMSHSEPVRLHPARLSEDDQYCYSGLFSGRRVLIVNPIAQFLCARASPKILADCWGPSFRWWQPASVEAFDIPNAIDSDVRRRFGSYSSLLAFIVEELQAKAHLFDIALVGAGAYGVPIVSEVARLNKVGIGIGGHLQVMFGVYGQRWEKSLDWQTVINQHWTKPPEILRPSDFLDQESGCYW